MRGAREHNLAIDELKIPKRSLVVFTGVSGSGKSSLAFDTLYAEGQRRYVESLSSYARQFLGQMEKPKYEQLRGLSPTIAIEQKSASSNPRSTVGTVTEIYDYLRVLYARAGEQRCHLCGGEVTARSAAEIVDELLTLPAKTRATLMAQKAENRKGEFREVFEEARKAGFSRVRINGLVQRLEDVTALDKKKKHTIEIVIDRVSIDAGDRARLTDSVEAAVKAGGGSVLVAVEGGDARARVQRGARLPGLRRRPARAVAAVVLVQQPARHVRRLQRPRLQHGDRPRSHRARPEPVDRRRRHRAVGRSRGTRPGLDRQRRGGGVARVRHPARQAVEEPDAAPARGDPVRRGRKAGQGHLGRQTRRRVVGDALRGRRQHDQEAPAGDLVRGDARSGTAATSASRSAARARGSACGRSRARSCWRARAWST